MAEVDRAIGDIEVNAPYERLRIAAGPRGAGRGRFRRAAMSISPSTRLMESSLGIDGIDGLPEGVPTRPKFSKVVASCSDVDPRRESE